MLLEFIVNKLCACKISCHSNVTIIKGSSPQLSKINVNLLRKIKIVIIVVFHVANIASTSIHITLPRNIIHL